MVEHERLTPADRIEERLMLELRLARGVRWADYSADLRMLYAGPLRHLAGLGLIDVDAAGFRLTRSGLNVADGVAGQFVDAGGR